MVVPCLPCKAYCLQLGWQRTAPCCVHSHTPRWTSHQWFVAARLNTPLNPGSSRPTVTSKPCSPLLQATKECTDLWCVKKSFTCQTDRKLHPEEEQDVSAVFEKLDTNVSRGRISTPWALYFYILPHKCCNKIKTISVHEKHSSWWTCWTVLHVSLVREATRPNQRIVLIQGWFHSTCTRRHSSALG